MISKKEKAVREVKKKVEMMLNFILNNRELIKQYLVNGEKRSVFISKEKNTSHNLKF